MFCSLYCPGGYADVVSLLLEHGAKPNSVTGSLVTPLHIASKGKKNKNKIIIIIIIIIIINIIKSVHYALFSLINL